MNGGRAVLYGRKYIAEKISVMRKLLDKTRVF